jgi:hypothetical protein
MTILKAEILSHLNKELNRTETDIDSNILSAMKKLSLADDFCWVESEVSMIVGRKYYSLPIDYKKMMTIHLSDGESKKPLGKISFRYYQDRVALVEDSDDYDEPTAFAIHGGFWYPLAVPDDAYTAVLHYNAWVPESETIDEEEVNAVDNIDRYFSDIYRDALNTLTKAYYCLSKQLKDDAAGYLSIFTNVDLPPLSKMVEREPRNLPYNDLM